jgi:hypothetical protein
MKHIWAATDDLSRANSGNTPCCEVTVFHAFDAMMTTCIVRIFQNVTDATH